MHKMSKAALLAAGAAVVSTPRAITSPVRADVSDPKVLIAQIQAAVTEMRTQNDARLANIEAKVDPVDLAQIDTINAAITDLTKAFDEQAVKMAALTLGGGGGEALSPEAKAYTGHFNAYMRRGENEGEVRAAHNHGGVQASMSVGSNPDGGYTAPIEWDRSVVERIKLLSPIRQEAQVQTISTAGFSKLFTDRQVGSGWVGETAARPATSTPQFTALPFTPGELYANAAASQQLLDDSLIDIEKWLAGEVDIEFARQEGIAFVGGDGVNKPFGFLTYVTGAANAARHPWGDIKVRNSGNATKLTSDGIVQIVYDLPAMYTPNAKWFMNRQTMGQVRLLKDGQGNYLWQPSYQVGQPSTLLGAAIIDTPDMPNIGAGAIPLVFGDMREAYLIVDRAGIRLLRDPYTNKPYICFYTTKRVGGGVVNPDAMKAQLVSA
jgi:HK97 family phage major capsid protein